MKKFLCFLLVLVLMITGTNVYAISIAEAGDNVIQEGEYDSIRLVAGNNVTNNATVNGINLIAGNQLNLNGISQYGFFAGNIVNVNESITNDLFVAGNNITIGTDAKLGRDVFIMGNVINITSDIKRDLRVGGETVDISGITINGDAVIYAERIIMNENTSINGKFVYNENTIVSGLDKATINEVEVNKVDIEFVEYTLKDRIIYFFTNYCAAVITLILLLLVIPRAKEKLDNTSLEVSKIFKSALLGFGVLIIIPIAAFIILFTGILTPVSLIIFAVYIISIYLSQLVSSYVFGKLITNKVFNKDTMYLSILVGVFILKLVSLIPAVGGLISAFAFLYGMGLIYRFIASRGK